MTATDRLDLDSTLARWTSFQECYIVGVDFPNFGYAMRLVFDYIWDDAGRIRSDLDTPKLVSVEFSPVYLVEYSADIQPLELGEDQSLAPGATEISHIQQSNPRSNASLAVDIEWDWGGRFVHVEFDSLSISLRSEPRSS
jgi:hypothetical protein